LSFAIKVTTPVLLIPRRGLFVWCELNEKFGRVSGLGTKNIQTNNDYHFNLKSHSNGAIITRQFQQEYQEQLCQTFKKGRKNCYFYFISSRYSFYDKESWWHNYSINRVIQYHFICLL
jgi:hypothetical protein